MSLWYFIVCFSLTCCLVSGQDKTYALVGKKVDFPGFSNKEAPIDILWKRVEGHNVHKVVHFDGSEEKSFGSFEDRVTLDWHSADLSISNLRYEDSGLYDLEIVTNNQHKTRRHELIVTDKVTKPTISCEINNASTSESAGKATLLCSLPSHSDQSSLEFQWSTNGQINPGHVLKIPLEEELDDLQYSCTVKNQLTQESAVFTAKDCYPEPKAQAGLIAGVVALVVVVLLLILLLFFIYLKKVRSNHKKSDLESHSNPGYLNVAGSGREETRVLLDRAPTFPSKHTLGHLNQRNDPRLDPPHKDEAHVNELREILRRRSSSEKPYVLPVKQRCMIFEKENVKANEADPRDIVEKEVLENNPSDPEAMKLTALSSESSLSEIPEVSGFSSPPAVSLHLDHPCSDDERPEDEEKRPDFLEDNPVDAEETKDALPGSENNEDEDNKASHCPPVPQKSNLVWNFSVQNKATENTNPKVNRPASNDSSDSGNPDEVPENQNSGSKKEENEFEKSIPENDVQPPPVAKESSPLSQNSPESSPEAERKQDINSDECAKASTGESSSSTSEESENEEQAPPASTARETDSETTVGEQKPL